MNNQNRRSAITVIIILSLAIIGLFALQTDRTGGKRMIDSGETISGQNSPVSSTAPVGSTFYSLLRIVSALAVVIGCIYGGIFLLKRLSGSRSGQGSSHRALEVLETAYVAPKKTISLVRVADKSVLVGVTENSMSVLAELDPEQTATVIPAVVEPRAQSDFAGVLRKVSHRVGALKLRRREAATGT